MEVSISMLTSRVVMAIDSTVSLVTEAITINANIFHR